MANIQSAKKRIRRNEKRRVINKNRMTRIRTFMKRVDNAIDKGDAATATEAFKVLQPELDRGVSKGIVKKNYVARQMSRLSQKIKKIA